MKRSKLIIFFLILAVVTQAQILKPVKWTFSGVPVKGKAGIYEVHMTAMIDKGWKTYSQSTPEDGPVATVVKFKPNPLVLLGGKVKEVGEMHKVHEEAFGVDVWYYKDKVDFVQVVKLKNALSPHKGDLSQREREVILQGTVAFMVCDAHQCLPVEEIEFSVELK
ncbi:protein-disulfide reductase DsbD domain-containing protein [Pedobacter frigoris]|uniref:protein-disulfide reductase DsbD domain-containing protein n=1 Tax=Pedobacter frigoris TaxID=2571272 RepID=UPI0029309410|nr:protein-disulfide reductase DsbD domain-containing protein [Pedobacter frigoris]